MTKISFGLFSILITTLTLSIYRIGACPQSIASICKCQSTTNGLRIECVDRSLSDVVQSIGGEQELKIDRLSIRDGNGIGEISARVFGAVSIRELDLTGNKISKIDPNAFDGLATRIVSLLLADNFLTLVPKLDSMTNLETMDLSGNSITQIPDNAFASTKKIRRLHFRANRICKLGPNALNETKDRLEFLDLSDNCLDEVPAQNLRGSQKLQLLDLSYNRILNCPSLRFMNLPALVELRLNGNAMEQMHPLAFMNVPNLEQLNLSANKLTSLDTNRFQSFSKLATLDLSGNRLAKVTSNSFQNVANLRQLILDNNRIQSVETLAFSSLPALQVISLQNNGLQLLYRNAFDALPSLTSLLLTNNSLDDIGEGTLSGMPALQQLILSNNRLSSLTSGSFDSVTQLTTLDLSDNLLTATGVSVFQNLNKLFWLDLSGNQLSGFPKDAFRSKISNLLLQGNPLVCNESIDWLVQYLVANTVRTFLPNQNDVTCADPPEKRGTLLKDLMLQRANDTFFNNLQNPLPIPDILRVNVSNIDQQSISNPLNFLPGTDQSSGGSPDLIKSLPQLAALLNNGGPGGLENMDLTKLPPDLVRYVAQGGQIPGASKEMMQLLTQRYIMQMAAKNGNNGNFVLPPAVTAGLGPSNTNPPRLITSAEAYQSTLPPIDNSISLPPLNTLNRDLIQKVLNGGTIPGLTPEQTEMVKRRYMQQLLTVNIDSTTPIQPKSAIQSIAVIDRSKSIIDRNTTLAIFVPSTMTLSPAFNLSDLQDLNIDFAKLPPDVLRDLASGRTPDFGRIPEDMIRTIMEKRPMLFGEIVGKELRTKIVSNTTRLSIDSGDSFKKKKTYDVNDLDKKADISVLTGEGDNQRLTMWTAVALGAIGAVTLIAVAVLCWRRRLARRRRRISRQSEDASDDTSKFFHNPLQTNMAPEPPPRRKVQFDDTTRSNLNVATISNSNSTDLMFNIDTTNNRLNNFDQNNRLNNFDQNNRSTSLYVDNNNAARLNNPIYNFATTTTNRNPPLHQFQNVVAGNNFSTPHFPPPPQHPPPPLPTHAPTRAAMFDHTTGTWMFHNGPTIDYHRRIDM